MNRMTRSREMARQRADRGQMLVLMAGGISVFLLVVSLIVDGGNAWAHQRIVQNGSDAAAEAGATVMAARLAGATTPGAGWDAKIAGAVASNAAANNIDVQAAYYTDICGIPLAADGTAALNGDGSQNLARAVQVGSGSLPTSSSTTPDCPSRLVGPPAGVLVVGHESVPTYIARLAGISNWSITAQATAVSGYLQGFCDSSQGQACAVLPVAFPVDVVSCANQSKPTDTGTSWNLYQVYKVPLCGNSPGNVGWLDWTPPSGGTSEMIDSILHPNNPAINLPSWQYVAQAGNPNSAGIETAIRSYDGRVVLIPQFDATCSDQPNGSQVGNSPNYGCPSGSLGGNGQNQWYRVPSFAFFQLCSATDAACVSIGAPHGAYVNGNNRPVCDTGSGATSCLVGRFVKILATGTVGAGVGGGDGTNKTVGIQLIK
jgi:hypothetical protein